MQLKIDTLCYGADAVARTAEGKTVFVSGGVPGDVVEAEITSDGKTFSKARVTSVVEASADRVASKCPYSAICGGCPWAEVSIAAQRQAKRKNVVDALVRIGKFDDAWTQEHVGQVVEVGPDWGYRNKVELAVVESGGSVAGLFCGNRVFPGGCRRQQGTAGEQGNRQRQAGGGAAKAKQRGLHGRFLLKFDFPI